MTITHQGTFSYTQVPIADIMPLLSLNPLRADEKPVVIVNLRNRKMYKSRNRYLPGKLCRRKRCFCLFSKNLKFLTGNS